MRTAAVGRTAAGRRAAARRRSLELADLSDEPWIGGAPNSAWYRIVSHACRQAGFVPRADFASDDYMAVQALVAAGFGISVIPRVAVTHPLPGVTVRQLASGAPVRRIVAARPRNGYHGPTVTTMLDSLHATSQALQ
jgi:DNA-binding transcriptional LysR family regulator